MVGIYKITNQITGKSYIGQSIRIEKRWMEEQKKAFNLSAHEYDYPLSRAFRKYGLENFTFEIIEECSPEKLNERERHWIHFYDSFYNGYNQTLGGDSPQQTKKETTIGIINDLKTTNLYHREIAEKWGVSTETVQGINTGRYWFSEYESYPLQTQHKKYVSRGVAAKAWYCVDCGKEISKGAERCTDCYAKFQRKNERPSKQELYDYLIEIQGNFSQAGRIYGVTDNSVRIWCKAYELPYHSGDYKKIKEQNGSTTTNTTKPRRIVQLDQNNNVVAYYQSIEDACRAINKPGCSSHISAVCKNKRKTAYGFKWQYQDNPK